MGKILQTTEHVDYNTGEVKSKTVVKITGTTEPSYIKLYLNDISYLYELPKAAGELMYELLNYVTYGTQEIVINSTTKKRISDATGLAIQTINNRLQDLVNKKILDRVDRGVFTLNPYLFGKGDWKSIKALRDKNVHLEIVYDAETNTRVVKGSIDE